MGIGWKIKFVYYVNRSLCSLDTEVFFLIIVIKTAAAAKSLQSCPTLCDPIDSSPPGSSIPGILQARTLECVAISFFSAWKWKVKVKSLSRVWLSATPWTAAFQAPPSMGFSRQEYWSGVPLLSPVIKTKWGKNLNGNCLWLVNYFQRLLQIKPLWFHAHSAPNW